MLSFLDVTVAEGRPGQHGLRALVGTVRLAAPRALGDLRALVLGDHSLELAQQLVLRGPRALGLLGEDDLDAGARELLQQQHLVGVAARQAIGRVAEQNVEAAVGGAVAQPLKRRPGQRRAGEPLILEDQIIDNDQASRGGQITQPGGLALDRLLHPLALGGHPRVDRRRPSRCLIEHPAALLRFAAHPSAFDPRAPGSRRPPPASPPPADRPRTRSQRAWPPRRSCPRDCCSPCPRNASATNAPKLVPRMTADDRAAASSDRGSLIVTGAVGSGTATAPDAAAAATYRRACRSEIACSPANARAAAAGPRSRNSSAAELTRDAYSQPAAR